ncbi:MAG: peptidase [Gammaproteobacteria bacterium HGW-Gammaproteobacteria-6]|nr:MAG: peptidase [Gammaproteobacteria bacterium HGW-Gammaproteobacteria-6]
MFVILLCLSTGWPGQVLAGRDLSQDEALYLVEQGVIKPLQGIIDDALGRYPGRFLEAELEWDDGLYVYEIEIITLERRQLELEYDAVSGVLLEVDEDD